MASDQEAKLPGGTPIWNRQGCSSEILNLAPKGYLWRYIYDKMQFSVIGIVCSKSLMHPPEAEGQKSVLGITQIVKMQKGIVVKGIVVKGIMQIGLTQKGITQIEITQRDGGVGNMNSQILSQDILIGRRYQPLEHHLLRALTKRYKGSCCFDFRARPVPSSFSSWAWLKQILTRKRDR